VRLLVFQKKEGRIVLHRVINIEIGCSNCGTKTKCKRKDGSDWVCSGCGRKAPNWTISSWQPVGE